MLSLFDFLLPFLNVLNVYGRLARPYSLQDFQVLFVELLYFDRSLVSLDSIHRETGPLEVLSCGNCVVRGTMEDLSQFLRILNT